MLFFNLVVESNAVCSGPINEEALAHYEDVINTCIEYGVESIVTLYHWDIPLYLQAAYGGWLSEQIVPDFLAYPKVVFGRYAPKVSKWVTVNQPIGKYLLLSPSETSTLDA
jgi:beta-glucosidase/6-phospho-beta-glucosidase/beta-galactosidase